MTDIPTQSSPESPQDPMQTLLQDIVAGIDLIVGGLPVVHEEQSLTVSLGQDADGNDINMFARRSIRAELPAEYGGGIIEPMYSVGWEVVYPTQEDGTYVVQSNTYHSGETNPLYWAFKVDSHTFDAKTGRMVGDPSRWGNDPDELFEKIFAAVTLQEMVGADIFTIEHAREAHSLVTVLLSGIDDLGTVRTEGGEQAD